MSRQQLSVVIGLSTGKLGLYGHLHRIGKDINPLCRRCLNSIGNVETLLCECEYLTISRGHIFWTKFWKALTTLPCPSWSILTVFHRNRTSSEIIVGGAQKILKGRSVLGSNDHPIKPNQTKPSNTLYYIGYSDIRISNTHALWCCHWSHSLWLLWVNLSFSILQGRRQFNIGFSVANRSL